MIVSPIIYTSSPDEWKTFVRACGATAISDGDTWSVFALGAGRLGIHLSDADRSGTAGLGLEISHLDEVDSPHVSPVDAGHGPALLVTGVDLPEFFVDTVEGEPVRSGNLTVSPLLMTTEVAANIPILQSLGLNLRVKSNTGNYVDFTADGVVALHLREREDPDTGPRVDLSFEHPDLDVLEKDLRSGGFSPSIVDENYGRSLQVSVGNDSAWVNETQTDLYGYSTE